MTSNLPPGITESMIPGNRPEDIELDAFHEWLDDEIIKAGLSADQARTIWRTGLAAWEAFRNLEIDRQLEAEDPRHEELARTVEAIVADLDLWRCPKCGQYSPRGYVCRGCGFDPTDPEADNA